LFVAFDVDENIDNLQCTGIGGERGWGVVGATIESFLEAVAKVLSASIAKNIDAPHNQ
jgi:hypothetical protein